MGLEDILARVENTFVVILQRLSEWLDGFAFDLPGVTTETVVVLLLLLVLLLWARIEVALRNLRRGRPGTADQRRIEGLETRLDHLSGDVENLKNLSSWRGQSEERSSFYDRR